MRFTPQDMEIVRAGLNFLSFVESQVLIYRFWENQTIEEISDQIEMTWDETDYLITEALEKLRAYCLAHSELKIGTIMDAA